MGDGENGAMVAAVVVTHRRPRLATDVVRSLLEREGLAPEQVFLVVNGDGGLEDADLEASIRVIRLPQNIGPAGGFRVGMLAARDAGARWFYLCEDDVTLFDLPTPRVDELVTVLAAMDAAGGGRPIGAVVAYGRDLDRRTGHTTARVVSSPHGFEEVDAACWGASLVSSRVVDAGILPDDDYFFGYEDFDFWYRMRDAGFRLLVDCRAAVQVEPSMSLGGRDRAFDEERPVDRDEPWRAFYIARNYFLLARRHGSVGWVAAHLAYSVRRLQLAASWRERLAIVRGLAAGARGRTGKDWRYLREVGELHGEVTDASRLVLHVLPNDIARGGQMIVRDLRRALDGRWGRHRTLTLFASDAVLVFPDYAIDAPMGRLRDAGFDPRAWLRLRRAITRLRPTIIVAHGGEPLKYLAFAPRGGAPLIYFAFGIVTEAARRGWRWRFYRALMSRADTLAGISSETLDEARDRFGIPESRLALLPNSRDPDVYRPSPKSAGGGPVTLVFVGHLTATKRPGLFVDVVAELRRRELPVRGVLVGDGPLEGEVRRRARDSGVEVLGRRSDVPEILSAGDVFVFTSVEESEGMPGVLIEAGLSGLATVSTATPGASTVIAEGETGYVVSVDDVEGLVDALVRLVTDEKLRRQMGHAARKRCVENFSLEASADRWCRLFEQLVQ